MSNRIGGSEPSFINPIVEVAPSSVQQSVKKQLSETTLPAALPDSKIQEAMQQLERSSLENCYTNIQVGSQTYVVLKEDNGAPTLYTTKDAMSKIVDTKFVMVDLTTIPEKSSRVESIAKVLGVGALAAGAAGSAILGLMSPALAIIAIPTALGLTMGAITAGVLFSRKKSGPAMEEKLNLTSAMPKQFSSKSIANFFKTVATFISSISDSMKTKQEGFTEQIFTDTTLMPTDKFKKSADGTMVFSHESTSPISYYHNKYGPDLKSGVNMDRVAVASSPSGRKCAVLFDGASSPGPGCAYAAQAFSEEAMEALNENPLRFTHDTKANKTQMKTFLERLAATKKTGGAPENSKFSKDDDNVNATALIIDCLPSNRKTDDGKKIFEVNVGALGDSAAFHLSRKDNSVEQLNDIAKAKSDVTFTGGDVGVGTEDALNKSGNISTRSKDVNEDDFIIAASDGLLDNLAIGEEEAIIALVANCSFFDNQVDVQGAFSWEHDPFYYPTTTDLTIFVKDKSGQEPSKDPSLTADKIARRLTNYVKMVTHNKHKTEQELFDIEASLKGYNGELSSEQRDQLINRRTELEGMANEHKAKPGKTDDCAIVVFTPGLYGQL